MLNRLMVAVLAVPLLIATPALAADLAGPISDTSTMSWAGPFIGGAVGYEPPGPGPGLTLNGELGYNFLPSEQMLIGVTAKGQIIFDGVNDTQVFLDGRVGFIADKALFYGYGGVGLYGPGTYNLPVYEVGVGAEFAVMDQLSIDVELGGTNVMSGGSPLAPVAQVGARFHF